MAKKRVDTVVLPNFELLKKQPDPPHVARVVATCEIPNRYGAVQTFRVKQSRKGDQWWISASVGGVRASNTLSTKVPTKGELWQRAVKACRVAIEDDD